MGQIINNPVQAPAPPAGGRIVNQQSFEQRPPYREKHSSRASSEATLMANVSWDQADGFPLKMLGDATGLVAGGIRRTLPYQHPTKKWLYCMDCDLVEGVGAWRQGNKGLIEFFDNKNQGQVVLQAGEPQAAVPDGRAVFQLTFRFPPWEVLADGPGVKEYQRYTIKERRDAVENMTLPGKSFAWKDKPKVLIEEAVAILRQMQEVTYTTIIVPNSTLELVRPEWLNIIGRVNQEAFDGYDAGKLLCLADRVGPLYATPSGEFVRDVTQTFLVRTDAPTWNHFYRRDDGFKEVVSVFFGVPGKPQQPYESAKFDKLFYA